MVLEIIKINNPKKCGLNQLFPLNLFTLSSVDGWVANIPETFIERDFPFGSEIYKCEIALDCFFIGRLNLLIFSKALASPSG